MENGGGRSYGRREGVRWTKRGNIVGASQGSKLTLERAQSEISLLLCHQSGCRQDFVECALSAISALGWMSKILIFEICQVVFHQDVALTMGLRRAGTIKLLPSLGSICRDCGLSREEEDGISGTGKHSGSEVSSGDFRP